MDTFPTLLLLLILFSCVSLSAAHNITQIKSDEYILLAFKSHITLDPSNILKNNWTSGTSFCTWIGVTCDSRRSRVTKLNISDMGLEGSIPQEIGNLSSLAYLDMSGNSFHGRLPKDICSHNNLQRLKLLDLSSNKLQGDIPSSLYQCPQLESIDLSRNSFGGYVPAQISNITLLKELDLGVNNLRDFGVNGKATALASNDILQFLSNMMNT
ncbi:LRR receptor-like serine/threonine-protein kinase EFR [Salvia miltiorrhiza]|uniref:LRR receptor-like serine/threonine-protein kinase EFR n=1 Tax=Salvia miltiorrhiza TaxID=226208 RepID=UPI0025AC15C4|nr:LRR receptor-like serine/threonine-protein kinase EFR [Salvia miltiorrhiza]